MMTRSAEPSAAIRVEFLKIEEGYQKQNLKKTIKKFHRQFHAVPQTHNRIHPGPADAVLGRAQAAVERKALASEVGDL